MGGVEKRGGVTKKKKVSRHSHQKAGFEQIGEVRDKSGQEDVKRKRQYSMDQIFLATDLDLISAPHMVP